MLNKLKENIMASSYEDRAGRSVISVKSVLEIIDQLAAEQTNADRLRAMSDEELAGLMKMMKSISKILEMMKNLLKMKMKKNN